MTPDQTEGAIEAAHKHWHSARKKPKASPKSHLPDEDWITSLETNPVYAGIDVRREIGKSQAWCNVRPGRIASRRFIINWLNRAEKAVVSQAGKSSLVNGTRITQEPIGWIRFMMDNFPTWTEFNDDRPLTWVRLSDQARHTVVNLLAGKKP